MLDAAGARFDLQLAFNLFPALYAHASWFARDNYAFCESDALSLPRSRAFWVRSWSSALLQEHALDRHFDFDFIVPGKRLALLDSQTLLRLGVHAAAVLMRERLRLIVNRAEVDVVRQTIGSDAHRFALQWSTPVSSSLTAACEWDLGTRAQWPDARAWRERGAILVASAIPTTAPGVSGRLQLKYPHEWSTRRPRHLTLPEALRAALADLMIAIVRAAFREWAPLFEPEAVQPILPAAQERQPC